MKNPTKTKSQKGKGQHYLLSNLSKTFVLQNIVKMSNEEVEEKFMLYHWGSTEKQGCPSCGAFDKHYKLSNGRFYKCKECEKQFSLTSGTFFHGTKLPLKTLMHMLLKFIINVKGTSAIAMSRELGIGYKTTFVWLQKFRELMKQGCIEDFKRESSLDTIIHMDGTYVHTNIRKANRKEDRKDARLAKNANPDKRCIFIIAKENKPSDDINKKGSKVILPFIIQSEKKDVVNQLAREYIEKGSIIHADESPAYDELVLRYDLRRVNHSKEYCSAKGVTNNNAESHFSRFKRALYGQYHKMTNKYLDHYAFEMAYRENKRRTDNKTIFNEMLAYALQTTTSIMRGYCQGKSTKKEALYE